MSEGVRERKREREREKERECVCRTLQGATRAHIATRHTPG